MDKINNVNAKADATAYKSWDVKKNEGGWEQ